MGDIVRRAIKWSGTRLVLKQSINNNETNKWLHQMNTIVIHTHTNDSSMQLNKFQIQIFTIGSVIVI